jgi:xanthosine utilization system XapX-like protein
MDAFQIYLLCFPAGFIVGIMVGLLMTKKWKK